MAFLAPEGGAPAGASWMDRMGSAATAANLALLIENAPAALALLDRELRYLAVSRRWADGFGLGDRTLVGARHEDVFPAVPARWREAFARCLAGDSDRCDEDRLERPDGKVDWVRWEVHPWRDATGEVGGIVLLCEIVTARRELQARVALASRLAALGTLASSVSHEMNNPLAAALASQGLALEELRTVRAALSGGIPCPDLERRFDGLQEALEIAQDGVRRTAQVVRTLALLGRPTAGRERIRLVDLVAEAVRWLPDSVSRQGSLRVRHGPAADVVGSLAQLGQVVARLVANGFHALPADGTGTVRVTTGEGSPGRSRIEVSDDGMGMDEATVARALDPLWTTREAGKGLGIGLPLCHAIVEASGGTMVLRSRPGRGTTVVIELPVAPTPERRT